jgi:hypothetical protein
MPSPTSNCEDKCYVGTVGDVKSAAAWKTFRFITNISAQNLITLCTDCHASLHRGLVISGKPMISS